MANYTGDNRDTLADQVVTIANIKQEEDDDDVQDVGYVIDGREVFIEKCTSCQIHFSTRQEFQHHAWQHRIRAFQNRGADSWWMGYSPGNMETSSSSLPSISDSMLEVLPSSVETMIVEPDWPDENISLPHDEEVVPSGSGNLEHHDVHHREGRSQNFHSLLTKDRVQQFTTTTSLKATDAAAATTSWVAERMTNTNENDESGVVITLHRCNMRCKFQFSTLDALRSHEYYYHGDQVGTETRSSAPGISTPQCNPAHSRTPSPPPGKKQTSKGKKGRKIWCLCNGKAKGDGRSIWCDNYFCKKPGFHWLCLGITEKPQGKWYCPRCLEL